MTTSGPLNTRASCITRAVPDPSSLAASPQPMPSMCPLTMYISSGWVRADLRAVNFFARPRGGGLRIELPQLEVRLRVRIGVHAGGSANASRSSATHGRRRSGSSRRHAACHATCCINRRAAVPTAAAGPAAGGGG